MLTEAENPEGLIPEQQLSVSYTSFDRPDTLSMGNKRLIFGTGGLLPILVKTVYR